MFLMEMLLSFTHAMILLKRLLRLKLLILLNGLASEEE